MNSFQVVMANSNLETFLIFLLQQQQQQRRQQPQREHFGVPWHQWRPLLLRGRLQQNFVREREQVLPYEQLWRGRINTKTSSLSVQSAAVQLLTMERRDSPAAAELLPD